MQFVRRDNEFGLSCIYLDMEGIELGIRDVYKPGFHSLTEDEFLKLAETSEPFKMFRVDTYNVLKPTNSSFNWDCVFGPVNHFLKSMTNDECRTIAETLISVHHDIVSEMQYGASLSSNLIEITKSLANQLDCMERELNLCERLEVYVNNPLNMDIPLFENAGKRAQDKADMTFHRPEVVLLTAITVLNKLLSPVLGVFIEHCKKQLDNSLKELHCVNMIMPILYRKYPDLVPKLKWYIRNIIKPNVKNTVEYVANGFTLELESQKSFANILVRKLVSVNLFKEGGNLMTYITASIKESTRTPTFMSVTRNAIKEMDNPTESSSSPSSEEGNTSALEYGSRCSDHTVDFPVLTSLAAKSLIKNIINEEEIDPELFEECLAYYRINLITMTPINLYLLATTYGYSLGGAKSIWALNMKEIIELVTVFQFQCLKRGYHALIPAVSLGEATHLGLPPIKSIQTQFDSQLKTAWNASFEYKNCKARFNTIISTLEWDTVVKEIVEFLINNNKAINLPFYFLEQLKIDHLNQKEYQYPEIIIKTICGYTLDVTTGIYEGAIEA